jgi:hypothetical protein
MVRAGWLGVAQKCSNPLIVAQPYRPICGNGLSLNQQTSAALRR